ncbi:MAG: hypothetical protein FJY10_07630 [Bacteroidetes bacterium]|nr:hypothetical protein [Bacteroidota bacterium]
MQFLNPFFLFALTAIAIPIIIHLFNFRRYKKIFFTNVRFLHEIKEETRKRSDLRQLILLLLRILTIIFMVLAFSKPIIPGKDSRAGMKNRTVVSIYVDNSMSMEGVGQQGPLLDEAIKKAKEIAATCHPDDQFQLLTADMEGGQQRLMSRDEFQQMLDGTTVSRGSPQFNQVLGRQTELMKIQRNANKNLFLISDFQRSFFNLSDISNDTSQLVFLVPVNPHVGANMYVDSCWFETPIRQLGENTRLKVRIRHNAAESIEKVPVSLAINGKQKAIGSFSVQPGVATTVDLPFTIDTVGIQQGTIEITDFPVVFDNRFFFSFEVLPVIRVLRIARNMSNRWIEALFQGDSTIQLVQMDIRKLQYSEIPSFQTIILDAPDDIPSGLREILLKYVDEGGSLVIFPPSDAGNMEMVRPFLQDLTGVNMTKLDTSSRRIGTIDFSNPVFSGVFERSYRSDVDLDLPVVSGFYKSMRTVSSLALPIMALQSKDPLMYAIQREQGKIYLFTLPIDQKAAGLPDHPIFVPLLLNMVLLGSQKQELYEVMGQSNRITIKGVSLAEKSPIRIRKTDASSEEFIPGQVQISNLAYIDPHDKIKTPGNYQVVSANAVLAGISYNGDSRESVMDFFTPEELKELAGKFNLSNFDVLASREKPVDQVLKERNQGRYLWRVFLILALLTLAAEIAIIRFWR